MHLGQETLTSNVTLLTSVAAAAALAWGCVGARREVRRSQLPALLAATVFIFLAQMVNCSMGLGFSGHLLGAALLVALFGPFSAMLSIATVLFSQIILLGDGAWSSLGANFLNMGVVAVWVSFAVIRLLDRLIKAQGVLARSVALATAAYLSILGVTVSLSWMTGVQLSVLLYPHSLIGFLEAFASLCVMAACTAGMASARSEESASSALKPIVVACIFALSFVPFSSSLPDGLQYGLNAPQEVSE